MFKNVLQYVKQLEDEAESTQSFLYRIRGGRRRLVNSITKAELDTKLAKDQTKYVAGLKPKLQKAALKLAKKSLLDATVNAIKKRQEFDIPLYRKPLYEAVLDDNTYTIRSRGAGFNSIVSVDINLNKTAGRLDMWGRAIKQARKELSVKVPRKGSKRSEQDALNASRAWAGIYNKRGVGNKNQYIKTIRLRLSFAAKPAPFWEILDKGQLPMPSDRGGYPTPDNKPLNFVDRTRKDINAAISTAVADERAKYLSLLAEYDVFLKEAQASLQELDQLVAEISLDVRSNRELKKRFGPIAKFIDNNKLDKAVQLIRKELLTTGRIDLSIAGSGKRVRPSVRTIKELL